MDLFNGAVGSNQVHDFNPGIRESGLFWTQPVAGDSLGVELEAGTASLALDDLDEEDYHDLHNALIDGPSDPASVSFEMRWQAIAKPMNVTDSVHRFTGRFRLCAVQIEWSATAPGFSFVSDPANTTTNVRSVIGRERNGVFFDE
ncbi:MAG: hypothetical protein E6I96_03485 [Chloroflexi bacterium]|nr:MAG: hypothetical protein E6I96_03485 [Chloroflexota bacterium]